MHISEINIYPIKSLSGIGLESATVEERGLRFDRRWMLSDEKGVFLTQREFPRMACISIEITVDGLLVTSDGFERINIPLLPDNNDRRQVLVWSSLCPGDVYPSWVNEWFSHVLATRCQLVHMPDDSRRGINPLFNRGNDIVSFADGYPMMILSEASLADLNSRMDVALPMNRFRPNLVVSGAAPFAEDGWKKIKIGETEFHSTKPSARCSITTVDQAKGAFDGKDPLKTLANYRMAQQVMPDTFEKLGMVKNHVLFGQNLVPENVGAVVRVGDELEVIG